MTIIYKQIPNKCNLFYTNYVFHPKIVPTYLPKKCVEYVKRKLSDVGCLCIVIFYLKKDELRFSFSANNEKLLDKLLFLKYTVKAILLLYNRVIVKMRIELYEYLSINNRHTEKKNHS